MADPGMPKGIRGVKFISNDVEDPVSGTKLTFSVHFPRVGAIVKIHRMFGNETMDEEHGRMMLCPDGQIALCNDSASGTFIYNDNETKSLLKGQHRSIKHGDSVIFGAPKYEAKVHNLISNSFRVVMHVILDKAPATTPLSVALSDSPRKQPTITRREPRRNKSDPSLGKTIKRKKDNRERLPGTKLNIPVETSSRSSSPSPLRVVKKDVDESPHVSAPLRPSVRTQDPSPALTNKEMHTRPHSSSPPQVAKRSSDDSSTGEVRIVVTPPKLAVRRGPIRRNSRSTSDLSSVSNAQYDASQRLLGQPARLQTGLETRSHSTSPASVVATNPRLAHQAHRNNKSTSNLPDGGVVRDQAVHGRLVSGRPNLQSQEHPLLGSHSPFEEDVASRKHTQLNRELTIPAMSGLDLGDGIDVLTGDRMMCALKSTVSAPLRNSAVPEARASTNIITFDNLNTLRSEIGGNIGAKINLPCPVDIGADIRSLFLKETHKRASIFFVQYQGEGTFPMERLNDPTIKSKHRNKSPEAFRNMHGDYFVDGIIRGYRHRIIVACSAKDVSNRKETEYEAKVSVANFFQIGGRSGKEAKTSENYSILDASMELYGYPITATSLPAGSLEEARKILEDLPPPTGSPVSAVLRHYSLLDYPQLPMEVNIDPSAFKHLQEMREIQARLQTLLVHPAIGKTSEERQVSRATRLFEEQRTRLAGDSPEILEQRKRILDELEDAEMEAEYRMRRWSLIEKTREMTKAIRTFGPDDQSYRWECGLLGVPVRGEFGNLKRVELKSGDVVWEIEWTTPLIPERRHWSLRSSGLVKHLRLSSESGGGRRSFVAKTDTPTFDQCIVGTQFIVLGWSLSCTCRSKTPPQVTAKLSDECILKDEFEVCIDASISAEWRCRVTFIRGPE
ncbi:hypothetical protein EYR36_011831 [Pleurotus pulmonarius]|nr:hypothetical protein EYR36_011831 [Pleurotus pulmonarius]KAF4607283.1 hypothetical protein EYR38_001344 [Pleurotus pulmonarius]